MSNYFENRTFLNVEELPRHWYNIQADLPTPLMPSLNPVTLLPMKPGDMEPLFAKELIKQEVSQERYIEIPDQVRDIYKNWRSTPLYRAKSLEKALDTPAKIYYKYEGVNPTGSHKLNTAVAQVYYNKAEGIKRVATETGAGQWGCALSMATDLFGLECMVYMVKVSYDSKPYRRSFMNLFHGSVVSSPSGLTESGLSILERMPDCSGSLGIAISEAVEDTLKREDTHYCLGSVLNHVVLHQTVIGLEAKMQLEKIGDYPDIVIGCHGGGSNFGGMAFPFMPDKLAGKKIRLIAAEPNSCPTLTKGVFAYDYGDTAKKSPVCKMYTLGHDFIPPGIHAGGLRYHGASPLVSQLLHDGYIEARALSQLACFEAATLFARIEKIIPAPESSHAICVAIDEALKAKEAGTSPTIVFCLSGHGFFDMAAYDNYLAGNLEDLPFDDQLLQASLAKLPQVDESSLAK
ncbi:MAG: TrpB-like pyridoxal phosphate-dependent enzyme [Clostridiales bacterium]